jgi:hypothetical protein
MALPFGFFETGSRTIAGRKRRAAAAAFGAVLRQSRNLWNVLKIAESLRRSSEDKKLIFPMESTDPRQLENAGRGGRRSIRVRTEGSCEIVIGRG